MDQLFGRRWFAFALACAGCDRVFGLELGAPGDEKDEDGDGVVNAADICPTVSNAAQGDRDGDDVGDLCDPHPDVPGDRIAARFLFDSPATDAMAWTASGWTFTDGYAEQAVPDGNGQMVANETLDTSSLVVEVEIVVTFYGSFQFQNAVGIALEGSQGLRCNLQLQSSDITRLDAAGGENQSSPFLPTPVAEQVPVRLYATLDRATGMLACRVGGTVATTTGSVPPGPVGMTALYSAARLHNMVVYVVD